VNDWINMLFYQATWVAAVAGAGQDRQWPGLAMLAAFAAWQLTVSKWRRADAILVVAVSIVGFVIDFVYCNSGLMEFAACNWTRSPVWMLVLWTAFALALNHSLAFLQHRPWWAALLGGVCAPLAYWAAGNGWHALTFGERPVVTALLTAAIWALLMPLCSWASLQLRRIDTPTPRIVDGGH
jgi:hypothetical protein